MKSDQRYIGQEHNPYVHTYALIKPRHPIALFLTFIRVEVYFSGIWIRDLVCCGLGGHPMSLDTQTYKPKDRETDRQSEREREKEMETERESEIERE